MRFDGMDAAAIPAAVPQISIEQPPADQSQAGITKAKAAVPADTHGMPAQFAVKAARNPAEAQPFETASPRESEHFERIAKEAVERANRVLMGSDRKFEITIHEKTKDVIVKVVDTKTNTTVREIPPKKIVDLVVHLCEMAGILFDKKG